MASPPHIPQINQPRKRGSVSSLSGNPAKKRKPSHLRKEFSPDAEGVGSPLRFSRSPSVDSVATNSVINGGGGKRRKRKGDDGGRAGDGGEFEDDDYDDDVDEMDMAVEDNLTADERRKQEKERERSVPSPSLHSSPY
jgi:transcription initiation factor TFIID subunit 11